MGLHYIFQVPSAEEIKELFPMSEELTKIKEERDKEIAKVFTGESDKFLAIIGPCSADNEEAVVDYTTRLSKVQEKIKDKIIIIPRIYTNKPRTNGSGYKGMLHQPNPEEKPNFIEGLKAIRKMHIDSIRESGLTAADEMLYSDNWNYMSDILSYVAVGARSVENQSHRLTASGIDVPVGMKNPTSGDYTVMMNSCIAGQSKHTFMTAGWEVKSDGNPLTHCILRGSLNRYGVSSPNYHYEDLIRLHEAYEKFPNLKNPAVIVDANHNNSGKKWDQQPRIVKEILHSMRHSEDVNKLVKGVMIESYIEDGNQPVGGGCYGQSITDPCLGWDKSERLLLEMAELL
ncbi:MAG: 3-deoxy-7-phosphoheptulonate synthase [Lachnospiraceae bacterium]|jgi:3-deoxy-7-phosphoheptulonate synthase|nr:3-deoxy-7-phosphoheptulonate synthase [Lachnospiraceae bacterium]